MARIQLRASGVAEGTTSEIKTGNHTFYIDEPESLGGNNKGPNPLQTVLGALIGCENIVANMVAKEINFDLQGIIFSVKGELDPRGYKGDPNVRTYFQKVEISAEVKTSESEDRIQELKKITDSRCPVFNLLKAADVEIVTNWKKAE
ncbi:osmotically inducible protein C [Bacillus methanolicus]|uniref:OsmC family protein n=1 Tax=Bacillus methanolicus TaxID=1471 RepID=UPI0023807D95|nr:OsmC family protein [Bacillus methanolicus]MDE3840414.1 osmotically inducible protein C [Bacillus methanolicus]